MKTLRRGAFRFYPDEPAGRLYCIGSGLTVLDLETLEIVEKLPAPVPNCNQIRIDGEHSMLLAKSTTGDFAAFRLGDASPFWKFRLPRIDNADGDFVYAPDAGELAVTATTGKQEVLFRIRLADQSVTAQNYPPPLSGFAVWHSLLALTDGKLTYLRSENRLQDGVGTCGLYEGDKLLREFPFTLCGSSLGEGLFADRDGIVDLSTGTWCVKLSQLPKSGYLNHAARVRGGYALALSEGVLLLDEHFRLTKLIPAHYSSGYYETENCRIVGTWEKIMFLPK